MSKFYSLLLLCALGIFLSCGKNIAPERESLDEKCGPNEFFSFQRSYPDFVFDWKGWRNTLKRTRENQKAQDRGGPGCGSNLSNWTQQGPMNVGARCNTLASKPDDENTVLAGFSGGGIFKSTDGAVNWHPVFDESPELSIGDITFSASNPNIVYAGTGDPNMPSIVFNGDGIYKSTDAGETWQHLPNSPDGVVSKVVVHPTNPDIVWIATMGNPYVRDNQRGIYKTTDGGQSWQQVLFVSDQAGASDLVQSPANPMVLYASFWDRLRNNHESIVYGPHARVYKSSDGGNTWNQLGGGLPAGVMGRTGLAVSQTNANKVYAIFIDSLSTPGGLYKTTDGGANWTAMGVSALKDACADFGWYFGKIRVNPANDEELYFFGILLWKKAAGSNTWLNAGGGHADSHDLIFTSSGRRYWSNDGGVYRNDGQQAWTKSKNLPVTQFYHTNYNPHTPDLYWGGAQDNGIQKGSGQNPNNWVPVFSADGFNCAFDPANPDHFWVEIQNGTINETQDGGDSWMQGAVALGTSDRTNWDTPFFMSPHMPNRLYGATYRVYSKEDASGWGLLSGDLTDGVIYGDRYHSISCLDESPVTMSKLIAGTSDGNVWRMDPNGSWHNITPGLPDRYVTSVHYSTTVSNRLFVTHSGFRDNEQIPHVHRSDDNGNTWIDISSDLPQIPVNDLLVLPGYFDQVLFAATDAGVYFTKNGGGSWSRLGGNMPFIPVFDLERNPQRKELIAATYARSLWTFPLDSVFVQQNAVAVNLDGLVKDELGAGVLEANVHGDLSDDQGHFELGNLPGCTDYTLEPKRLDNPLNGVTTYDIALISKHILSIEPLNSPFKVIAADVNHSNSVTTFDVVQLRRLILGIDTAFANNTSWRFVPKSFSFPNPLNPFQTSFPETLAVQVQSNSLSGLDFTGIKIGDVNNSAAPSAGQSPDSRTEGIWPLKMVYGTDANGLETSATLMSGITPEGSSNPLALQFTLQFDPSQYSLEGVEPLTPGMNAEHFGLNRSAQGLISFSFSRESPLESPNMPLFTLKFKAKKASVAALRLNLVDRPTPSLIYPENGEVWRPVFMPDTPDGAPVFMPNPFGLSGTLVKSSTSALLEIFDGQGRSVFSKKLQKEEPVYLNAALFAQKGVYFWRMGEQSGKLLYAP